MTSKKVIVLSFVVLGALFSEVKCEDAETDRFLSWNTNRIAHDLKSYVLGIFNKATKSVDTIVYRVNKILGNAANKCHSTLRKWANDAELRLSGIKRTAVDVNITAGICLFDKTIKRIQALPIELCQVGITYQQNITSKLNVFERRVRYQLRDWATEANAIVDKGNKCANESGLLSFKCFGTIAGDIGHAVFGIPGKIAKFAANVDALFKVIRDHSAASIKSALISGEKYVDQAKQCIL